MFQVKWIQKWQVNWFFQYKKFKININQDRLKSKILFFNVKQHPNNYGNNFFFKFKEKFEFEAEKKS